MYPTWSFISLSRTPLVYSHTARVRATQYKTPPSLTRPHFNSWLHFYEATKKKKTNAMECSFVRFWYKWWKDNMMCASGSIYWLHDNPLTIFGKTWQKAWCTFRTWETVTSVVCPVFFVDSQQYGMAGADNDRQLIWFESLTRTHAFVFQFFLVKLLKECYEGRLTWSSMIFIWARTHQKMGAWEVLNTQSLTYLWNDS